MGGWILWTAKICKVYRLSMDAGNFSRFEIDLKVFCVLSRVLYGNSCFDVKKLCQDYTTEVLSFVDV